MSIASMAPLQLLVYYEGILFLGAIAAIIFMQLLTGGINTRWLLYERRNSQHYFSPGRVQLLVLTLGGALNYQATALQASQALPPVPAEWLAILGGSNGVYLAGKAYSTFMQK